MLKALTINIFSLASGICFSSIASGASVELNANLAGCIKPSISHVEISHSDISADLFLEREDSFSQGPCVCRGGFYYYDVYPSERRLPDGRAWMHAKSYYHHRTNIGVLPSARAVLPTSQKIHFPAKRNTSGALYDWYYLTVGCD